MYGKDLLVKDIREKLQKHYDDRKGVLQRHLRIHKTPEPSKLDRSVFFSLHGSPPKGYGIYICEARSLNLYDHSGRRWQILSDISILDLDNFKDDDILVADPSSH